MRKALLICLLATAGALLQGAAIAEDRATAIERFNAGNEAYKAGQFPAARDAYLAAYAAGATGPSLCYNLGNTYYKLEDAPHSVLWYRRALRGAPRNHAAATNLKRVLLTLPETMPDVPPTWVHAAARWVVSYFSLGELSAVTALLLWALTAALLYGWRRRKPLTGTLRLLPWGLATGLALFALLTFVRYERDWGQRHAIVVAPGTRLMSGPGAAFDRVADAGGGLDVCVVSSYGAWLQVTIPTGVTGWAQKSDVEQI